MRIKQKLLLSLFMGVLVTFILQTSTIAYAEVTGDGSETNPYLVSTWSEIADKLINNNSSNAGADPVVHIKLSNNIYASDNDRALAIQSTSGYSIEIDLNGHILSRNLSTAQNKGYVIGVIGSSTPTGSGGASVTIKDSSNEKTGKITGGNNTGNGGGIYVDGYLSVLTFSSGSIEGNSAAYGGGIYFDGNRLVVDGNITNNTSINDGGGIYIKGDHMSAAGGVSIGSSSIANNTAVDGGGIYLQSGKMSMSSGTITNNSGCGVFFCPEASFDVWGNSTIINNSRNDNGTEVNDNLHYKSSENTTGIIRLLSALQGEIGIYREAGAGVFASSVYSSYNFERFISDSDCYVVRRNSNNEAYLGIELTSSNIQTVNATYNRSDKGNCVSVVHGETSLVKGTDYEISFKKNGSYTSPIEAGDYTVNVIGKGYYVGNITTTFQINPREISLNWENDTFTYNGNEQCPTATVGGLIASDECSVTVTGGKTDANAEGTSYTAIASSLSNSNYKLPSNNTKTFTIEKADFNGTKKAFAIVPVQQATTNKTLALPALPNGASYSNISAVNDEASLISAYSLDDNKLIYSSNASNSAATATFTISVDGGTNYNDYNVEAIISSKSDAGVTITGGSDSITYGDEDFTLSGNVENAGEGNGTWIWSSGNDEIATIDENTGAVSIVSAGSVVITTVYESDTTYGSANLTLVINKANTTVTSSPSARSGLKYTGEEQDLINEGKATGGIFVYKLGENGEYSSTIPKATDVGNYEVYYYVQGDKNHLDTSVEMLSVSIDKADETQIDSDNKEIPNEDTPNKDTTDDETHKENTPNEDTPKDDTPSESTPTEEPSIDETPTDPTPTDETPAEETPTEETPTEETPTEETPTEETPADETPEKDTPNKEDSTEDIPKEEPPTPKELPISDSKSSVHQTDGSNAITVSAGNAVYSFDVTTNTAVIANTKADISAAFADISSAEGYESSAKHRYRSSNAKIGKVDKKGILLPKKSGEMDIIYEQKTKGSSWTPIGEKLHLYIQVPTMEKKVSASAGDELNAYSFLSHTTYSPSKWISSNPSVATVDSKGDITILKPGKTNIIAQYEEGKRGSKNRYKTKLIIAK